MKKVEWTLKEGKQYMRTEIIVSKKGIDQNCLFLLLQIYIFVHKLFIVYLYFTYLFLFYIFVFYIYSECIFTHGILSSK